MTIEIVCPTCESGYVLDESSAGGDFVCPSCSQTMTLGDLPAASAPEITAATDEAPATAAVLAPPLAAEESATRHEIVCPRCQLHFAPEKHTIERHQGDRPSILIVEEEGYSRDASAEALSKDYDVVTAGTVDAGARILALGNVDLMILDLDLDHGFGKRLLRQGAMKTCPIVIYGHDEAEFYGDAWEASRNNGADDMVIKGMNAAETLVRKVGALLGRPVAPED